ncbi:enolase C-terminal domain-like protein [Rubinisphaera brasiliensis]|uniref:Transmembrane prediction n=1 Tax=Rubinisphaera brasiliensis (strain ATCC 49424 / DSM 5305 / JCM 21570 / IAM 15109 / NBRC 103401 / IFAM 1448) TaxID=756272 RepID=F0SMF3_RUBBR|nr:enolase C-terminal domain-like protein [Rubinisphaera brasiliensis]ADY57715.1 transmembrane prediction [Rubinisphaera brasiliensis DSM 5305]
MPESTDVRIVHARVSFEPVAFRAPLKFGGRVVSQTDLINVTVDVEDHQGRRASGHGSMPVGNVWAWPSANVDADQAERAMKHLAELTAVHINSVPDFGHPIELMYSVIHEYGELASVVQREFGLPEGMPKLAQLVANSPLDAALHDAYGRLHGKSSYNTLSAEYMNQDLSVYLGPDFAHEYLDRYTLRDPKTRMPLYHLVGALDPLGNADIESRINDGLPETLEEWIRADGLTHLKIKLNGEDLNWDVERVLAIDRITAAVQAERNIESWHYSCDFNEKCENVEYVLDFLGKIKEQSEAAFDRIQYIEQPTHRNLKQHPENKMHAAAKIKPVVIDESLVDLESLELAQELGYTGVAFKACKGQTETLLFAAAAIKRNLFLCVQDLTCPGASFLHSATLAARIPGVAAIEGNGRQYCPGPNAPWAKLYPGMFEITDGTVETGSLNGQGMGFSRES